MQNRKQPWNKSPLRDLCIMADLQAVALENGHAAQHLVSNQESMRLRKHRNENWPV